MQGCVEGWRSMEELMLQLESEGHLLAEFSLSSGVRRGVSGL